MCLPGSGSITVGEESVGYDLGRLTSGDAVAVPEVWLVGGVAWLRFPCFRVLASTCIPSHYSPVRQSLYVLVEGVGCWHICIGGSVPRVLLVPCRVRDDLRHLPSGCCVTRPEVRTVATATRLCLPALRVLASTCIPSHHATMSKAVDEGVEGRAWGYIFVDLSARIIREACGVGDDLGYLTT